LLRLHHNDRDGLLATLCQIGVLRNGDIERLAEGNAIGAQHENGVAVGHIFIGRGSARNKSRRRQSRPARLDALLRQSRYQGGQRVVQDCRDQQQCARAHGHWAKAFFV
jgi:hypothetical protein